MKLYAYFTHNKQLAGAILQSDLKTEKGYVNRVKEINKRLFEHQQINTIEFIRRNPDKFYSEQPYKTIELKS